MEMTTRVNLNLIQPTEGPFKKVSSLKQVDEFRAYLDKLGVYLPLDDEILTAQAGSPLALPFTLRNLKIGNRWCIQPMEGWDGTLCGKPSDLTTRRWQNFGLSGAKLIWGGEAFAVQHDGRANPNQLFYHPDNVEPMRALYNILIDTHRRRFGTTDDLFVGLQLTHSARFAKPDPDRKLKPKIFYHHPLLDPKFGIKPGDDSVVLSDDDIKRIIDNYILAAKMAEDIGFNFVDVKLCHGYGGHESLSAFEREGQYGGDFKGRTRFVREIIGRIQNETKLLIGVRLSAFDTLPYKPDETRATRGKFGPGIPVEYSHGPYPGFGLNPNNPKEIDLTETIKLLQLLQELGVVIVNITAGSPYYNPHIQRPAFNLPSDAYQLPEDPLIGAARQIHVVRELKEKVPGLPIGRNRLHNISRLFTSCCTSSC